MLNILPCKLLIYWESVKFLNEDGVFRKWGNAVLVVHNWGKRMRQLLMKVLEREREREPLHDCLCEVVFNGIASSMGMFGLYFRFYKLYLVHGTKRYSSCRWKWKWLQTQCVWCIAWALTWVLHLLKVCWLNLLDFSDTNGVNGLSPVILLLYLHHSLSHSILLNDSLIITCREYHMRTWL